MSNTTTRKTIQDVENLLLEIGSKSKIISEEYINNSSPLEFICECGKTFKRCFSNIQQRRTCQCRKCGLTNGWKNLRREETYMEGISDILKKFDFVPLDDLTYVKTNDKLRVSNKDGYLGEISIGNIKKGIMFSVFSIRLNEKNLLYNLNHFCKINGFQTIVKSYITKNVKSTCKIKIICKCSCGNEYIINIGELIAQKRAFCKECTKIQSINEKLVKIELEDFGIKYIEQKRFDDCRSDITNYKLPFDFYLEEESILIEVDGEQHFKPTRIKGMSVEKSVLNFEKTKHNDEIKTKYCTEHNIKLIRISYKDVKNKKYKEIIQSIVN